MVVEEKGGKREGGMGRGGAGRRGKRDRNGRGDRKGRGGTGRAGGVRLKKLLTALGQTRHWNARENLRGAARTHDGLRDELRGIHLRHLHAHQIVSIDLLLNGCLLDEQKLVQTRAIIAF